MNFFTQTEQTIFIIALIANIAMLVLVLRYAEKTASRIMFCLFILAQAFWITMNSFAFRPNNPNFLIFARLTIFAATFHAFFFYLFMLTFLEKRKVLKKSWMISAILILFGVAGLTLSPMVFPRLAVDSTGGLAPTVGVAIPIFGSFVGICILGGFYHLIRKYRKAIDIEKTQWQYLLVGLSMTFLLVVSLSFFNFVILKNLSTVRFGHLYTLPFLFFTAYAMIKHHLLNMKAVVAELLVVILVSLIFIQTLNSETIGQIVTNVFSLAGTLIVGILLIRGVIKEIRQRELLEILTKKLQEANEQLKVLDQARAEFITIASHQLRTPPATIKWYLAAILDGDYGKFDDSVKEQLRKTASTNNSMIALIDDLLNASRIERGKMEFIFQPTDLIEITQITVDQLLPQAEMKKLNLVFEKPKIPLPVINADKEKLRQVINNMIDNAIKYTQAGKVEVALSQTKKDLMVKVTDSGKGVTADQLKGIFQKYDRGKSPARNSSGLGLGLYVAKVIVEQHKGKIWVESKGEGKGSSFIFTIPIKTQITETVFDLTKSQQIKA